MKSRGKRPSHPSWWWAAYLVIIVAGVVGAISLPRGPAVGPTVSRPLGSVSLPSTVTTHPSAVTSSSPVSSAPVTPATTSTASTAPSSSTSTPRVKTKTPTTTAQRYIGNGFPHSRPISISIPAIGVSAPLTELGLNPDRTVQVPTNFAVPGWYKYGPSPGQTGSAVILGHVDNINGPAVFFYLDRLRPGDRVVVKLADRRTVTFKVIGVRMYSKNSFPDQLVYGPRHYPALQLVTCGGVFDRQSGHYLSNIVVFTARV